VAVQLNARSFQLSLLSRNKD